MARRRLRDSTFSTAVRMVAGTASVPAPIAGLNVRDSLAAMDQRFAVVLENMFPTAWGVQVRKGWKVFCNLPELTKVMSVFNYCPPAGAEKLFAVQESGAGGKLYEAVPGAPVLQRSVANTRVQTTNYTNAFGSFVLCANGADTPFYYNGTAWANLTQTGYIVPPPPDGPPGGTLPLAPANLIDVTNFRRRVWWVEKNSTRAWYGGVDEIQGVLEMFDLGEVFQRGGSLMEIGTWTVDAGNGINDHIVFISSEGDIAMFSGTDPNVDFALSGLYKIAPPINRRSAVKRGGDLLVATYEGVVSLAMVLQEQSELPATTLTDVIKPLLAGLANGLITDINDWCLVTNNKNEHLIYNTRDSSGFCAQYIMNMTTKAWTKYTNMDSYCWCEFDSEPYFGTANGAVARAWYGTEDGVAYDGTGGELIQGKALQAFNYFDSPGKQKFFNMARPIIRADSEPSIGVALAVDFNTGGVVFAEDPTSLSAGLGIWDVSFWDQALWAAGSMVWQRWFNVGSIGVSGAVSLAIKCTTQNATWLATDVTIEAGGVL